MRTDRPLTLSVTEAGNLLGVSRSTAYELVRTGELESIRLRRRCVVPVRAVADHLGLELEDVWAALTLTSPTSAGTRQEPAPASRAGSQR